MRVIGVLDLLDGRAVHARAGRRERYAPVRDVAGLAIEPGDALALARFYIHRCGLTELYAADLDAILSTLAATRPAASAPPSTAVPSRPGTFAPSHPRTPAPSHPGTFAPQHPRTPAPSHPRTLAPSHPGTVSSLVTLAVPLWLDAGIAGVDQARDACDLGATRVVVGLETLPSFAVLEQICSAVGGERVAFSLDLRDGEPMVTPDGIAAGEPAHELAIRAADAGTGALVVLDVARVGSGSGLDMLLIDRVRAAAPGVMLLAGGGVRDLDDLRRLADAGCDGALVATALHSGLLSAADVAAARLF